MAVIASFPSSILVYRSCRDTPSPSSSSSSSLSFRSLRLKRIGLLSRFKSKRSEMAIMAVAEDEAVAPVAESVDEEKESSTSEQSVSVPVSPSDMLTMFFKAEGTMNESGVGKVSKALEGIEGVSDLKVQVAEGIASVELTKQTTVQATGVASNLVEVVQGAGLKLQYLHLSFEDEEDGGI